jgi:hypothetical protein
LAVTARVCGAGGDRLLPSKSTADKEAESFSPPDDAELSRFRFIDVNSILSQILAPQGAQFALTGTSEQGQRQNVL